MDSKPELEPASKRNWIRLTAAAVATAGKVKRRWTLNDLSSLGLAVSERRFAQGILRQAPFSTMYGDYFHSSVMLIPDWVSNLRSTKISRPTTFWKLPSMDSIKAEAKPSMVNAPAQGNGSPLAT